MISETVKRSSSKRERDRSNNADKNSNNNSSPDDIHSPTNVTDNIHIRVPESCQPIYKPIRVPANQNNSISNTPRNQSESAQISTDFRPSDSQYSLEKLYIDTMKNRSTMYTYHVPTNRRVQTTVVWSSFTNSSTDPTNVDSIDSNMKIQRSYGEDSLYSGFEFRPQQCLKENTMNSTVVPPIMSSMTKNIRNSDNNVDNFLSLDGQVCISGNNNNNGDNNNTRAQDYFNKMTYMSSNSTLATSPSLTATPKATGVKKR